MPHKLIVDSGSTKAIWQYVVDNQLVKEIQTVGVNPYYQNTQEINSLLTLPLQPLYDMPLEQVFFYGAGCSTKANGTIVMDALNSLLPQKPFIEVHTDMLGAARASCGQAAGIVCILGTGANACLYNGKDIDFQPINLGFWLGDEGSGGHLGKQLITAFLHENLPNILQNKLKKQYNLSLEEVLLQAYQKPYPNRYFAQFSHFLFQNRQEPFVYQLIYDSFSTFIDKYITKIPHYTQYNIHFVGSIAFNLHSILQQVLLDKQLFLGSIFANPMEGLRFYHAS